MHIGHLRNSCIGDALVRILKKTGYNVEVHNYVDDLGNQLADTVVGLMNVPLAGDHVRFGDYCWDIYAGINKEYVLHPETVHKRTEILHALEEGNGNTAWLGSLVAERIVREHVEEMKNFGITYDLLVWESSILKEGFWTSAFALLEKTAVFVQETEGKLAGCWILKQSATEGTEADSEEHQKDKVLVRSNGFYPTPPRTLPIISGNSDCWTKTSPTASLMQAFGRRVQVEGRCLLERQIWWLTSLITDRSIRRRW